MKKVAWLTDLHFEFIDKADVKGFCKMIMHPNPDLILIGGDIGNASTLSAHLHMLNAWLQVPIYFVLGNHDFYGSSLAQVRAMVQKTTHNLERLHWLPLTGLVPLTQKTALLGYGGWADGRLGKGHYSNVSLNDYFHIQEFIGLSQRERFALLAQLGDDAADYFRATLPRALKHFEHVLLLTHVPPFRDACWHEGAISNDNFLPHFTCSVVGDLFKEMMKRYPHRHLTVLCGHTHSAGVAHILPNLVVKTGQALYGTPELQEVITIE